MDKLVLLHCNLPTRQGWRLSVPRCSLCTLQPIFSELHPRQLHLSGNRGAEPAGVMGRGSSYPLQCSEVIGCKMTELQHKTESFSSQCTQAGKVVMQQSAVWRPQVYVVKRWVWADFWNSISDVFLGPCLLLLSIAFFSQYIVGIFFSVSLAVIIVI